MSWTALYLLLFIITTCLQLAAVKVCSYCKGGMPESCKCKLHIASGCSKVHMSAGSLQLTDCSLDKIVALGSILPMCGSDTKGSMLANLRDQLLAVTLG